MGIKQTTVWPNLKINGMNFKCEYRFQFKFLIALFWTVIAIAIYSPANSQTFSTKTFTTENGLSHNFVQHITQDKTGFLWISTWDGINRYDGYEFRNYFYNPKDSNTVPFFVVDKAVVDASNNVWAMCQQRPVVIYNRSTDSFDRFKTSDFDRLPICDITLGTDSTVWMITRSGVIYHYNSDKKKFSTFQLFTENDKDKKIFNYFPQLLVDNKGGIWIISIENQKYEVFKGEITSDATIQLRSMNYLPINIKGDHSDYKSLAMYDINVNDDGQITIFSKFGLFCYDPEDDNFVEYTNTDLIGKISGKPFYFWSDEKSGVYVLETNRNEVISIKPESGKLIENMFVDSQKNIWIADYTKNRENIGLIRYTKIPSCFRHYLTDDKEPVAENNLPSTPFNTNSDKWIALRGFDYIFRIKQNGSFQELTIPPVNGKNPKVHSMACDSLGFWLGCTDNCLFRYDYSKNKFYTYVLKPDGEEGNTDIGIHNIISDKTDLIINGGKAIYRYNTVNKKLTTTYNHTVFTPCFCMIRDDNNGYWLGVNSSRIIHLDYNFNEISTYKFDDGGSNVEHICPGDSSDVWVALMGGGLGHLYTDTGKMEVFTTADGLINNTLLNILKDKKGNLWISTNKGISFLNPRTRQFRSFGKTDGLLIEEFYSDANYQAADGEMFFGGVGGIVSFYPDSVEKYISAGTAGKLLVTELKVSGMARFFEKPVYELDNVKLKKGDDNFQLSFSCLDFRNSEKIKYRYRLAGKNNIWTETDHRLRNINYANLVPGKYNLEIEATNSLGNWDRGTSLHVTIPSFYYQTLWFKILIIIVLTVGIAFAVIIYNRQIRLGAKQKQDELRLESLRGQMNPHFIFNALNSVNYFISNNDKIAANSYIADFSRLIRSILNNLSCDYIPLEQEIESIRDYLRLEHLRFSDKFNYELKIESGTIPRISVFPGLVQPFIENAIWHGVRGLDDRTGFISVSFKPVDTNILRCIVEDDGIGRKQAELSKNVLPGKKSRGIGIVQERLKIISEIRKIQYNITIEDVNSEIPETGTRVVIDLPIQISTVN
jgi:ligand-binding sensor domain-containing protein